MNWLNPNPFERLKKLRVLGRRWRDQNGNTYHTATVIVNGRDWKTSPVTYGYGDHYLDTAAEMLEKAGMLTRRRHSSSGGKETLWRAAERLGIPFSYEAVNVKRKKDL